MSDYFNMRVLGEEDRNASSIIGHVAYTSRCKMHDEVLKNLGSKKHTFDFTDRRDELYYTALLVPPNAPEFWKNSPLITWTEAQKSELAASTGLYRKKAQLAKLATVHFNRVSGIPLWEQVACLEAFLKQQFVDPGLVAQIDVHPYGSSLRPDTNAEDQDKIEQELENYPNTKIIDVDRIPDEPLITTEHILRLPDGRCFIYMPHGHVTISTRIVTPEGFSKHKARHLNPSFAKGRVTDGDDWTDKWIKHQNEWYKANGYPASGVKTKVFERSYTGKAHNTEAGQDEAEAIRQETLRRLRSESDFLIELALEHQATFSAQDLRYILRRAGMTPKEAGRYVSKALKRRDVTELYDVMTSKPYKIYTCIDVRHQERLVLQLSDVIKARRFNVKEEALQTAIVSRTMNAEQVEAFRRHVGGEGITFCQGRAGAGKSYMVSAVREAHEASGYDVVGLAPTNSVASDMKKDGFAQASTVHAAVFKGEKGKLGWNENTIVVVDEAGMLDTEILLKLMCQVATSGAKLVMVGDDRQLSSVGRGGMWPLLTDRHGAALMNKINRQEEDWQKAASVAFSEGRVGDAVRAYNDQDHVHWAGRVGEAMSSLLKQYAQDTKAEPNGMRFIYASTNATVNELNAHVHNLRAGRGEVTAVQTYETDRGQIQMGVGDRIQFYDNKKDIGIINGLMGRVVAAKSREIQVETESGETIRFDPTEFTDFGHGYAGTVYRGQGKTVAQSYCLYDSKFAWSAKSAYVAMTRHKKQVDLFVPRELAPDFEHLVRQVSREGRDGASLNWATRSELQEFRTLAKIKAPASKDQFKKTWCELWAEFVVRSTDVISGIADATYTAINAVLGEKARPKTDDTSFDVKAYRRTMRNRAYRYLVDEYNQLTELLELTEFPDELEVPKQKLHALMAIAEEKRLDLTDDPRPAQDAKRDAEYREAIKQAQRPQKKKT